MINLAVLIRVINLVAETKTGDEGDTYSLVMLDTAGNDSVTVTTKEDRPELEKKVKEKNGLYRCRD